MPLFSDRSLWTMLHGLVLSGGALMALAAALFALRAMAVPDHGTVLPRQANALAGVTIAAAVLLWLSVIGGTYVVFPLYRATPPADATSLAEYPRALLLSRPETSWLHAFGMEIKEHLPWMAAMLATAAAFVATRYRATLLGDSSLRSFTMVLLAIGFAIAAFVALMGVFINKVAPLQ